ncbi:hypothetical protein FUA23_07300 [Neolewinella aurantiaca]|uniref:Uncharacterized protein n=1 Tax=Neolewinella aurantiaca TaxID=2602767 RepID=A0A5C7FYT5_9BACT|nr:hypothetical protein [Neolewinella aurantiaca]TXF90318.1 hypothetical protein FUA23_07300 [Neolewinella aurantiaca]
MTINQPISTIQPGNFQAEAHWYPKALNATIHPLVSFFMNLSTERIVSRYCHLNPKTDRSKLEELLAYQCRHFLWSGADLIHATTAEGNRRMVVIENNSCPSGQKSMPLLDDHQEDGGYRRLVERTFLPLVKKRQGVKVEGRLAVIYDKNPMETTGYAAVIADVFNEDVLLITDYAGAPERNLKLENDQLFALVENDWVPLRAVFRYVTQKPWNRLPITCRTKILNPIVACLAGGRNKMVAAKAYDFFNGELAGSGLEIHAPETIRDVAKAEIPLWVARWGGQAVIKIPYSNAGQGVFTITNEAELAAFMATEVHYDRYIVQSLIGNYAWSSDTSSGRYYHVGTIPNKHGKTHVCDIRMMVSSTPEGIRPLACYSRRAREPLADQLTGNEDSWAMLGTNLSEKLSDNQWSSDVNRLMLMDRRDFNSMGVGLDDLIEAFIQTVLSTVAIDRMAGQLFTKKGKFSLRLFKSLNDDKALLAELL